jgi:K+-sensing histidine kinase KdpD
VSKTTESGTSTRLAKPAAFGGLLITVLLAAILVAAFTGVRALLNPLLGAHSPLMIYILAVLIAGFARGGLCGLLVIFASGFVGEYLFAAPPGELRLTIATLTSLALFWTVSLLVLGMTLELARRANEVLNRFKLQPKQEPPRGD